MGGFPQDESKAFAVISWGAVAGTSAAVEKIIVKSPHEAMGIPTKEANAQGLQTTRQIVNMIKEQHLVEGDHLRQEVDIIIAEVSCIMDKILELGNSDLAAGTIRAFEAGVLDIPFAPSKYNNGKVLPIRDNEGFIRLFTKGNLPLNSDIISYHQERLGERSKAEGRETSFQMVTDDIYAISKGNLIGRPK